MQLNKICLMGFMCSGKTSVGKELSKLLNYNFIDLDEEIIRITKTTIPELFKYGEYYFRDLESKTLKEIIHNSDTVLSLGGGTLLRKDNLDLIFENHIVIFLDTDLSIIKNRFILQNKSRPLFNIENVEDLYEKRKELYKDHHLKIITNDLTIKEVAMEIFERIKKL